jgi:hypothetical protein
VLTIEALQRAGVRITEEELDQLLVQVVSAMVPAPLPTNPRMELTEADAAALERGGLALEPLDDLGPDDPIVKTVAIYASLLASSLPVSQVAHILGVSAGRVRQELYTGTIYGIKETGGWRLPRWQFTDDLTGLLPGIRRVLPHLDRGMHPVAVYTWFTSPDPDLTIDANEEITLSPRDWLRSGRNPQVVGDLADALGIAP